MSPLLRVTAPFGFPGPNISVSLSLCVYFWVMPVVPCHKMVRLWGPYHHSMSSFSPPTYSGTVIILFFLLFLFLSLLLIFLFLLSSVIRARVPHGKTMVKLALGEKSAKKLNTISLSNNTMHRRISQLSDDIKEEVIQEIKRAGLFSIQVESTDVQFCSKILDFVRFVHNEDLKKEFLFCQPLEQSTKGEDVMQKLTEFFESEDLDWQSLLDMHRRGSSHVGFLVRFCYKSYTKSTKCYTFSLHDPQASSCIKNATLRITRHFEYNYKDS